VNEAFETQLAETSRLGPAAPGSFTGAAGGAPCGDLVRISLEIGGGRVAAVSLDTEGCGATRAATNAAAELIEGAGVLEAAAIGAADVDASLGGLSPGKQHAARLAADAVHRALSSAAGSATRLAEPDSDRVLVAVSGGVDSAVAALLERERGAKVVAVTLKLWADPETDGTLACCSPEAVLGARALAHSLGLPHLTLDLEDVFRRRVVDQFVSGYAAGETPNPCVLCNGEVRIAAMLALADRIGAADLITGHYARTISEPEGALLAPAADTAKDQSYMLSGLDPHLLARLRFPLAQRPKAEVRAIAERHGLSVARKPESQDLCFLAGQGKRAFLRRQGGLGDREGDLLDRSGRKVGRHRGQHHFTVGQRRGIGLPSDGPLYVLAIDAASNTVTVGSGDELATSEVLLRDAVLHRDGACVDAVKLRYHAEAVGAAIEGEAVAGRHTHLRLSLSRPFAGPARGQTAVLLRGEAIVGHGTIAS
jgi:tRNA-specific 2-thiouridylase